MADDSEFFKMAAFTDAARELLMNEQNELDYGLLKGGELAQTFAISIGTRLRNRAKTVFGAPDGLPWYRLAQLTQAYAGVTAGQLKSMVDSEREDFTVSRMAKISSDLKENTFRTFGPSAWEHIPDTPAARATVLSELGLTGKMDPAKAKLEEIVQLMVHYHGTGGVVSPKMYERSQAYIPPGNHGGH
ncbi:hypothetical protein HYU18_02440 [Candidatus Woesearchaeota archaeon]|nr:hypothetical protein [Candidatus Woesearchaeota archaeon]